MFTRSILEVHLKGKAIANSCICEVLILLRTVEDMGMANIKEDCELEYGLTLCFYLRPWPKKRSNWECLMKVETTSCSSIIRDVYCNSNAVPVLDLFLGIRHW